MKIVIMKELYERMGKFLAAKPYEQTGDRLKWYEEFEMDLRRYTMDQLSKLAAEIEKHNHIRGTKTMIRDITNWIQANTMDVKKLPRARNCSQACDFMIAYLSKTPRKHVYAQMDDGDGNVTLCYYVDEIKYNPPKRGDYPQPAYMTISLVYEEFGGRTTHGRTVEASDCIAQTAPEILVGLGLLPETEQLRDDYEYFLEQYNEHRKAVGRQMLARGLADTKGVDGNVNRDDEEDYWYWRKASSYRLDANGERSKVVVDVFRESEKEGRSNRRQNESFNQYFWDVHHKRNVTRNENDGDVEWDGDEDKLPESAPIEIPVHPYIVCFDLTRHKRLRIHIGNLEPYKFNPSIRDSLVLPKENSRLIDTLLIEKPSSFKDVIHGKTGGVLILSQGPPGCGKTLTAEVYSEAMGKALYTVQCSQLGIEPEELETELLKSFARARRWSAIMLLDEADVYVHQRGNDLVQNAIVGVFLRTLEYFGGVLFLTTNRGDLVDDAILSRCTARIPYRVPSHADQFRIWQILAAANGITLDQSMVEDIVSEHPGLSGRDVKNLLKLATMVAHAEDKPITADLITHVKQFKPTNDGREL